MSLRNHCDVCGVELPPTFPLIGITRHSTPTEHRLRYEDTAPLETAEVCSLECAIRWLDHRWAPLFTAQELKPA